MHLTYIGRVNPLDGGEREAIERPESVLVESFNLGNTLLKNKKEGVPLPVDTKKEFDRIAMKKESSLSTSVRHLVCESFQNITVTQAQKYSFTKAGNVMWDKVREVLGEGIIGNYLECDFNEAVRRLHPVCHSIHKELNSLEHKQFEAQYKASLQWTGCGTRFSECFKLLKSSDPAAHSLCLLLLTSSLEHSLGDIYLSYSHSSQCPSVLKDLLATQEMKDVFGDVVVCLLHILIGPPSSLNLRNLLWHGFAAPEEVPTQYASLLLVITASLYNKLEDHPFCSREIKRLPLLLLPQAKHLSGVFPVLDPSNLAEIHDLFHSSFFIIPRMLPLWLQALYYFRIQRFDWCVILLLPQLEHGLRRVFACTNSCPHRVLTAESTILYTTFGEILSPVLQDGSENLLRQELEASYLEMLLDILVHPEGPRIRDHISHGEVDLSALSKELANHILCICIAFAGAYTLSNEEHFCAPNIVERICETAKKYKSIFHPVALLKRTTRELSLSLLKWQELPQPNGEEFDNLMGLGTNCCIHFPEAEKAFEALKRALPTDVCVWLSFQCLYQVNDFVQSTLESLDAPIPTLFRPRGVIEVTQLLRSIAQHGKVISEQICEAATVRHQQWERRQLRQRQRANYRRLWSYVPFLLITLQLLIAVILTELLRLYQDAHQGNRAALIKFLKRCLQCSENLESLSSVSRNRWDECYTVVKTFVDCVEQHYSKQSAATLVKK